MDTPKSILKLDSVKVLNPPNMSVISPPPPSSVGQTLFSLLMPAPSDRDNNSNETPCAPTRLNKSACDGRVAETPNAPSRLNKSASRIGFSDVNVFYFPRTQGHVSVPREGGSTIGMADKHIHCETLKVEAEPEDVMEEDPHVKRKLFEMSVNKSPVMNEGNAEDVTLNSTEEMDSFHSPPSQDLIYRSIIGVIEKDVEKMLAKTPTKNKEFERQDIDISFAVNSDVTRSLSMFPIPDLWENTILPVTPVQSTVAPNLQWRSPSDSNSPPVASTISPPVIPSPIISPCSAQDEPDNASRVPFDFCQTLDKGQVGHYHVSESASAHCQAAFQQPDKKVVLQRQSSKVGELGTRGLTPLNSRARKALLKASGVTSLDKTEAEEAKLIRESRRQCGCNCVGECLPGKCSCMVGGLECQVESLGHPCKCNVTSCGNPLGRKEFDEAEVKMHYIETLMNLQNLFGVADLEKTVKTTKISFKDVVSVFYFPRTQGFLSVPKEGGNTLGMGKDHFLHERLRLDGSSVLERTFSETDPPPVKRTVYTPDITSKTDSKMSPFSALYEEQMENSDLTENPLDVSISKYLSDVPEAGDFDDVSLLKCSICGDVCKRAVILNCCQVQACRSCAIKKITSTRKCWNETCVREGKLVTTDLVNYDILRTVVDDYRKTKVLSPENSMMLRQQRNRKRGMSSTKSMPQLRLTEDSSKPDASETDVFHSPQKNPVSPSPSANSKPTDNKLNPSKSTSCLKRRNPSTNKDPVPLLTNIKSTEASNLASEVDTAMTNSTRVFISSPRLPRMAKSPAANKALAISSQPSVTSSTASKESSIFSQGTPVSSQQGLGTPAMPTLTPVSTQQGLLTYSHDGTPAMPTLTAGGGLRFSNLGGQSRQPLNYSNAQGNDITGLNQALKQDAKSLIEILESHSISRQNPTVDPSVMKPKTTKDTSARTKVGRSPRSLEKSTPKVGSIGTRGLTPLNPRARTVLLKNAGISVVDKSELEEIRAIRESRKKCGCDCKKDCLPWKCPCALQEISCQVEEDGFPCGCSAESCGNGFGRREFNEAEVKMHYLETMMNVQLLEGKTVTEE